MGMDAGIRIWYGANLDHDSVNWDVRGRVEEAVTKLGDPEDPGLDVMLPGMDDATLLVHYPAASDSELVGVGVELFYKDWDYGPWTVEEMDLQQPGPIQVEVINAWLKGLGVPEEAIGRWAHTLYW